MKQAAKRPVKQLMRPLPSFANWMDNNFGHNTGPMTEDDRNVVGWELQDTYSEPYAEEEQKAEEYGDDPEDYPVHSATNDFFTDGLDSPSAYDSAQERSENEEKAMWAQDNLSQIPNTKQYKQQRQTWKGIVNQAESGMNYNDADIGENLRWMRARDSGHKDYKSGWDGSPATAADIAGDELALRSQSRGKVRYFENHPRALKKINKKVH